MSSGNLVDTEGFLILYTNADSLGNKLNELKLLIKSMPKNVCYRSYRSEAKA